MKYKVKFCAYVCLVFGILWFMTPRSKTRFYKPKLSDLSKYTYIDENNICYKYTQNEISS